MSGRVFGLRNAYSVIRGTASQRQLSGEETGRRLFGPVVSGGLGASVVLRNGARLHLESVSRPEYATADCGSVPGLVVHDKAGERILEGLLEGIDGEISMVKISDSARGSLGCQESYLIARRGEFSRLADILIPFLVTRQLICGEGAVAHTPSGAVYCLTRPAGSAITRSRPFINTRDEPHSAGLRRLRLIVSDPAMSETTTLLKVGATDLVLRMAEQGTVMPDLTLDNPVRAIAAISRDITGRDRVRLADGRQLSALDIQCEYLAGARDFTGRHGADAVTGRVLRLWERALEAIGTGDLTAIAREVDWAIKHRLIEDYRARHGLPLSDPQVAWADLAYHDVRRSHGLYYQLQRTGAVDRVARDVDIFEAKTVPPGGGRYRQAG